MREIPRVRRHGALEKLRVQVRVVIDATLDFTLFRGTLHCARALFTSPQKWVTPVAQSKDG